MAQERGPQDPPSTQRQISGVSAQISVLFPYADPSRGAETPASSPHAERDAGAGAVVLFSFPNAGGAAVYNPTLLPRAIAPARPQPIPPTNGPYANGFD